MKVSGRDLFLNSISSNFSLENFACVDITKAQSADLCDEEYKRDKERFADYLIRKGVLSPKMLQELKNELLNSGSNSLENISDHNSNDDTHKSHTPSSKRRTKKRK